MDHYYVNDNAQTTGEHEIHKDTCDYFDEIDSKTELGFFPLCSGAIQKARAIYSNVDGCYFCCRPCHTR